MTMYEQSCIRCGVRFSMPTELDNQLRNCHNTFYCPNGHKQYYPGKSETEKLEEERDKYKRWYEDQKEYSNRLQRSCSALRGVITRVKNHRKGRK